MSDKIKSDYRKYMENQKPSDEFLLQLTHTLKDEQAGQKRKKIRRIRYISTIAACLLLVFSVSALLFSNSRNVFNTDSQLNNYAGEANTESIKTVPFENIDWYDDSLTGKSLPEALAQKLKASLNYLSYSSENRFVDANHTDAEQTDKIIETLMNASESSEAITGTKLYYMAVFTDGTVAKFSITDNKYVEISGDEKIYKN